ncbi:hypothetical protein RhiirC2_711096 [Rhizophagus irregularis]|uniref:Uncharacterized protein n=1 Tax=Rhizophagus irregularis TaxID=588596 RepID=A0A2N1NC77_9GLOM|nr:hypothetical protein RhiirC2_711096 [Rhizophagus irregularis]
MEFYITDSNLALAYVMNIFGQNYTIEYLFILFISFLKGFGIWDLGFGIWDLGFGIWDLGFGTNGIWDSPNPQQGYVTIVTYMPLIFKKINNQHCENFCTKIYGKALFI